MMKYPPLFKAEIEIDFGPDELEPFVVYALTFMGKSKLHGTDDLEDARQFASVYSEVWGCPVIDRTAEAAG